MQDRPDPGDNQKKGVVRVTATRAERVLQGLDDYRESASEYYDEVLDAVAKRARQEGAIGKVEIGALIAWKRLRANTRWVNKLMATPEDDVLAATRTARAAALAGDDVPAAGMAACRELAKIPGCRNSGAVASTIVCALAPERMAVYDRRARKALRELEFGGSKVGGISYGTYMEWVETLRRECSELGRVLTAREIDLALYQLGR